MGPRSVYYDTSQKMLIIGERRGGDSYTALDITTYNAPSYLYSIGPITSVRRRITYERLGQSWSRPEKATIATSSTVTTSGLRSEHHGNAPPMFSWSPVATTTTRTGAPPSLTDSVGRAVFAVNMATGALINNLKFSPATHPSLGMTHSVVDVAGFDHDGDGIVSRIYFGDLGGNIFALKDDQVQTFTVGCQTITKNVVDGTWAGMKLFNAPRIERQETQNSLRTGCRGREIPAQGAWRIHLLRHRRPRRPGEHDGGQSFLRGQE